MTKVTRGSVQGPREGAPGKRGPVQGPREAVPGGQGSVQGSREAVAGARGSLLESREGVAGAGGSMPEPRRAERTETIHVPEEMGGARIDRFLASRYPSYSRSSLQKLIREGLVKLGGKTVRPSAALLAGDAIEVGFPPPPTTTLAPEAIPLSVVYEDLDLMVIDKPAGMVVHPGAGNERGTLVHALLARAGSLSGIGGPKRPGIVHRLDRGTSGLLVVAKTDRAHLALVEQFRGREVEKVYRAVIWGRMKEHSGTVEASIGRDRVHRQKMAVRAPRGRPALSHWTTLSVFPGFTFVEVRPETGRTHQIRVHMQSLGHPIVGDDRYGGVGWRGVLDPTRRRALRSFHRLALHAARLCFRHPSSGKQLAFEAPLPDEFRELLGVLGA